LKEVSAWQESKRQKRHAKKFRKQFADGDITQEEMEAKLAKHTRTGNSGHEGHGPETFSLLSADRNKRKRQQVQNFASLLLRHCKLGQLRAGDLHSAPTKARAPEQARPRKLIVDFGCGSGNLCLSLAASTIFRRASSVQATGPEQPEYSFLFTDRNAGSLEILKNRARKSGLVEGLVAGAGAAAGANVGFVQHSFSITGFAANMNDFWRKVEEKYGVELVESEEHTVEHEGTNQMSVLTAEEQQGKKQGKNQGKKQLEFDLGIGLHCCGSFTDMVMEICRRKSASCIVCPCCNGKMHVDKLRSREQHSREQHSSEQHSSEKHAPQGGTAGAEAEERQGQEKEQEEPFRYPRSNYFKHRLLVSEEEYLQQLSRAADDMGNYSCKCLIELDRAMWALEEQSHTTNPSANECASAIHAGPSENADTFFRKMLQRAGNGAAAASGASDGSTGSADTAVAISAATAAAVAAGGGGDQADDVPVDLLRLAPTECSPKHHVVYVRRWS
jgi:hypothetical protein